MYLVVFSIISIGRYACVLMCFAISGQYHWNQKTHQDHTKVLGKLCKVTVTSYTSIE